MRQVILLLLVIMFASCSKPFLTGKKHQLKFGVTYLKKTKVKVVDIKTDIHGVMDITFVNLRSNDTIVLRTITRDEFDNLFKPIK